MSWDRKRRLEELLKVKIATVVLERLNDPRLGFLTITRVQLTQDKRLARVYYTVLGEASVRRTTGRALDDAARHVAEVIAPTLRMRAIPELRFVYDETVAVEEHMHGLLDEISGERAAREVVAPPAEDPERQDDDEPA